MAQAPKTRLQGLAVGVIRQVRELRRARGVSAAELADALAAEGIHWDRSRVTAIENGRRASITIDEWLALARVLSVPPLHLLLPVDAEQVTLTPDGPTVPTATAAAWIVGDDPSLALDPHSPWWRRHRPAWRTGGAAARAAGSGHVQVVPAEPTEPTEGST